MTDKAISEARTYVERAINDQARLGYKTPPAPVVKAAIARAAAAVDALMALSKNAAKS
jgi:hypothetical protein